MRLTHDPEADAATLYLVDSIEHGGVARIHICDTEQANCAVILDFDSADRLIAIELLGASRLLPGELLKNDRFDSN
jgi:uncharacterized protein YuzE